MNCAAIVGRYANQVEDHCDILEIAKIEKESTNLKKLMKLRGC